MPSKIDGSKYYYWRERYIKTGSLKAFNLMTRHYAAMPVTPVPPKYNPSIFDKFIRMGGDIYDPFLERI